MKDLKKFNPKGVHACREPMDQSLPGSSAHGILRQEYWSGLPCSSPGDFPDAGIEPASPVSPALAGGFFTTSYHWETPS